MNTAALEAEQPLCPIMRGWLPINHRQGLEKGISVLIEASYPLIAMHYQVKVHFEIEIFEAYILESS